MITGFDIHPSKDYIILTSDQGFYYVFRIETGELWGKVPILSDPLGLSIDPSGLYIAVSVKTNSSEPDMNTWWKWTIKGDWNVVEGSRTRIIFYELGTGLIAAEINSLFDISTFSFCPNGKLFVAASKSGCVSIWAISDDIINNILKVMQ